MPKKKVSRWLASIYACPAAQHQFRTARTFDEAWKLLDFWLWVWWLGHHGGLKLDRDWDLRYTNDSGERDVPAMKRRIYYKRVKAKYLKFKGEVQESCQPS